MSGIIGGVITISNIDIYVTHNKIQPLQVSNGWILFEINYLILFHIRFARSFTLGLKYSIVTKR